VLITLDAELDEDIAMKFIVHESISSILEGVQEEELTYIDRRTVATLEEAKKYHWFDSWHKKGKNHREENGMIACDRIQKSTERVVEISSLDELLQLQERFGEVEIVNSGYLEITKQINI
jgi:hypothetical protein